MTSSPVNPTTDFIRRKPFAYENSNHLAIEATRRYITSNSDYDSNFDFARLPISEDAIRALATYNYMVAVGKDINWFQLTGSVQMTSATTDPTIIAVNFHKKFGPPMLYGNSCICGYSECQEYQELIGSLEIDSKSNDMMEDFQKSLCDYFSEYDENEYAGIDMLFSDPESFELNMIDDAQNKFVLYHP